MRQPIVIVLAAVLMAGITAGCFDSASPATVPAGSEGGSPAGSQSSVLPRIPRWVVRYEVGIPRPAGQLPACPTDATCRDVVLKNWPSTSGRPVLARLATRQLACPGGPADYRRPVVACRALATLQAVLRTHTDGGCMCPPLIGGVQGEATMRRGGRTIVVPLTFCPYCGHKGAEKADSALRFLMSRSA